MAEKKSSGTGQATLALLTEANQAKQTVSPAIARFEAEGINETPWNPVRVVTASASAQASGRNGATQTVPKVDGGSTAGTQGSAPKS